MNENRPKSVMEIAGNLFIKKVEDKEKLYELFKEGISEIKLCWDCIDKYIAEFAIKNNITISESEKLYDRYFKSIS